MRLPAAATATAKSVILLYLGGGLSHHDSFDPKPDAPGEVKGAYGTIATHWAVTACRTLWTIFKFATRWTAFEDWVSSNDQRTFALSHFQQCCGQSFNIQLFCRLQLSQQ